MTRKQEKFLSNQLKIRYNTLKLLDTKFEDQILKKELNHFLNRKLNIKDCR